MWDKIKMFLLSINFEIYLSLYLLISMFIIAFTQDMNSINTLIPFYTYFSLVLILGGISKLRDENKELKQLIEEKLTK